MAHKPLRFYKGTAGKNVSFFQSVANALRGFGSAVLWEANVRRHILIATLALVLAWWLQVSLYDFGLVLLAVTAVLTLELINSSIEALADAVHPDYNEHIQRAKDMSAAAVLLVSAAALVIGILIFAPPLLNIFY